MRSNAFFSAAVAALIHAVSAKDGRTFAVLRFNGDGPLMEGRLDPIVQPGTTSAHVHTVMGASNFGMNATSDDLARSSCTNAAVKGDMSAYWFPKLYFHDKAANSFEPVEMFYMNVYYFFEGTNDQIKAFPHGLQMVSGNANLRTAPASKGEIRQTPTDPQPASWTCPRSNNNYNPPSWPANSDGSTAGFQNGNNQGEGVGFPFANCDGYASPLRADLHFPSCYNPAAGLTNWKNNMAFPSDAGNGKQDCPKGWIHTPHIFFEVYWNTPKFSDRWTPNQGSQPFVLSNGDRTGFSMHGDFMAAWDEQILQNIIDNCNAGHSGLHQCPGVQANDPQTKCKIQSPVNELVTGKLSSLPGNNPLAGWGVGDVNVAPLPAPAAPAPSNSAGSGSSSPSSAPDAGSGSGYDAGASAPANDDYAAPSPTVETKTAAAAPTKEDVKSTHTPGGRRKKPTAAAQPATEPVVTQPAHFKSEPEPALTSKVIETVDADGKPTLATVWETVTAWETVTVYARDAPPAPTPDAINRRHMHDHMRHHHHNRQYSPRRR